MQPWGFGGYGSDDTPARRVQANAVPATARMLLQQEQCSPELAFCHEQCPRGEKGCAQVNRSHRLAAMLIAALLLPLSPATSPATTAAVPPKTLELKTFSGLKTLFHRLQRQIDERFDDASVARNILGSSAAYRKFASRLTPKQQHRLEIDYAQSIGYWQQFQKVAAHVFGADSLPRRLSYPRVHAVFIAGESAPITVQPGARERDRFVERMSLLGYTPQEVIEVLSGRISLQALKQAERMRSLGYRDAAIAAYLERQYNVPTSTFTTLVRSHPLTRSGSASAGQGYAAAGKVAPASAVHGAGRQVLDRHVVRYARDYRLDPNLIRAIIANESSWQPQGRSPAGAIGLMQLMPSTAEMLGVNPLDPEQNIEGGVRYLAALLEMFDGDLDAALVGYNAGPSHARKWRKGNTVLYGETRAYLNRAKDGYAWQNERYVHIDWGPEFEAQFTMHYPEVEPPALVANIGWLGIQQILHSGGAGFFPRRITRELIEAERLWPVEGSPVFSLPVYLVYPQDRGDEIMQRALAGLRALGEQERGR